MKARTTPPMGIWSWPCTARACATIWERTGERYSCSYQLDLNGSFAAMHDLEMRLIRQGDD